MDKALKYLEKNLEAAMAHAMKLGKEELRKQGHHASGKLERSFASDIEVKLNGVATGSISVEDYGIDLDRGIPKNRIKYPPSQLLPWIKIIKPGMSPQAAMAFAKNIKKAHEREGMPTKASKVYSSTGRRTGWIKDGIIDKENEIGQLINLAGFLQMLVEGALDNLKTAA